MNSQMGTQDAVPIFHCTAGSHTILPSTEQLRGYGMPIRSQSLHELRSAWAKDLSALPCPSKQIQSLFSQRLTDLQLDLVEIAGKQQQTRQGQLHMFLQVLKFFAHRRRGFFLQIG